MASRLFQSVVASSALLLSGAGCGSAILSATAPDADRETAPDRSVAVDAPVVTASVDAPPEASALDASMPPADVARDVVSERRAREAGWPTTKGVSCTALDGAVALCCRGFGVGHPTGCCLPQGASCEPCVVNDAGVCVVTPAGGP